MKNELLENFGRKLFDDAKMKERLPAPVYRKWKDTMDSKASLDRETADVIAHAMKEWALENGCTHFTHWFQPLTGVTAEKHDCFLDQSGGETITKFSGKNLIKGEPDASSFPSGGLRATFEARGYTYWDCTSPAFIKEGILCIPTIFIAYTGEALDVKAPLLKSMELVSKASARILNIFGDKKVASVMPVVGLEQEYFLVDLEDFRKRTDLLLNGETLLGAMPAKSQELENHYLGAIPQKVAAFMKEVNEQLWELGIYAKSEHNEVAPGQFELAPIFANANIAVDQNQLIMEILQKTALRHHMVCLLHEKPFRGVNGSGKHNNYSLLSDTGVNLFSAGKNPHENIQFLLFIAAFVKAVDEHAELIRLFSACPGNDYRLGANEAPPGIVSIFLGDAIDGIFGALTDRKPKEFRKSDLKEFGLSTLSYLPHDNSDRNRTSPIAFTGNKFEVRMLGSSMSAGYLNIALNTIMADSLEAIADEMEKHKYRQDVREAAIDLCIRILKKHERVVFSGDGYSPAWAAEAEKRGLLNIKTFVEAIAYCEEHNSGDVFVRHGVLTQTELKARFEVLYENEYKVKSIEVKTLADMMQSEIYPVIGKNILFARSVKTPPFDAIEEKLSKFLESSSVALDQVRQRMREAETLPTYKEKSFFLKENVLPLAREIRADYDRIEGLLDKATLPYPTYQNLFFKLDH